MAGLNPILAAARNIQSQITSSAADLGAVRNQQADLSGAIADAQLATGASNALIATTEGQADLQAQLARQKIGVASGVDVTQPGEVITSLFQQKADLFQKKQAASQKLQENDSISFMDNPLGYIISRFEHNHLADEYNSAERDAADVDNQITSLNAMANNVSITQNQFKTSVTQATIEAKADSAMRAAQVLADQAKIQGLGYNAERIKDTLALSNMALDNQFKVLSAENAQAQLKLAMDNFALHKQQVDWELEKKEVEKAGDQYFAERMQKGAQVLYGAKAPDFTVPATARQYLALFKAGGDVGKEARDMFMAGQSGVIGGSPAQVLDLMKTGANIQFTPAQTEIRNVMEAAMQDVSTQLANKTIDKNQTVETYNQQVRNRIGAMTKEIDPASPKNLFNIPAIPDILQHSPAVASTPLAQKVLIPAASSGIKLDDPNQVFSSAMQGVLDGKVKFSEAVEGLTAVYQRGVKLNLDTKELPKFGIALGPEDGKFFSYNTRVKLTGTFGGSQVIDLTNKEAVTRAASKFLLNQQAITMGGFAQ